MVCVCTCMQQFCATFDHFRSQEIACLWKFFEYCTAYANCTTCYILQITYVATSAMTFIVQVRGSINNKGWPGLLTK